jgi:hypothetical protein
LKPERRCGDLKTFLNKGCVQELKGAWFRPHILKALINDFLSAIFGVIGDTMLLEKFLC